MQELIDAANKIRNDLKLKYNAEGVKFIEDFLTRSKNTSVKEGWDERTKDGLIKACSLFLGQCIIENYGGQWIWDATGEFAIAFDDKNVVFPFTKVRKQFNNGLEDSIYSMYTAIPKVFKLEVKSKKKWWQF